MYDAYTRFVYNPPSVDVCSCRLCLVPVHFYHSARRCCCSSFFCFQPSYAAVVGTLLELHYYFNILKNNDDPKLLVTASKLALYHLCSSRSDGFWGLYRHCSRLESVRFLGIVLDTPGILSPGWLRKGNSSPPSPLCYFYQAHMYLQISTSGRGWHEIRGLSQVEKGDACKTLARLF